MSVHEANFTSPPSKKRSHDGEMVNSPFKPSSLVQEGLGVVVYSSGRQHSPALSTTSSSLSELTPSVATTGGPVTLSGGPIKKRKMTSAEREVAKVLRKQEKEDRDRQKAEEKSRKEEEKRAKDEEKRRKEEEKEAARREKEVEKAEKQKAKEAKKQAKEAEKAKEEAERVRKEKSQMRLGAFFGRPAAAATPPSSPHDVSSRVSSRRSSIGSVDDVSPPQDTFQATVGVGLDPDFQKWMPPFFVKENMKLAPANRFVLQPGQPVADRVKIDQILDGGIVEATDLRQTFGVAKARRVSRPATVPPIKDLVEQMQGTANIPIDLTRQKVEAPTVLIEKVPMKFLFYSVDVRPPYHGTYTKAVSPRSSRKMSRNPFHRGLPHLDYDYDSEAEWEEGADDDEELNDEDDELEEEEDGEDMGEFLDDDNDLTKRRMITSDIQPVSTGLCWEGEPAFRHHRAELEQYRLDMLQDDQQLPIDPFSTEYWRSTSKQSSCQDNAQAAPTPVYLMQPPRLPLSTLPATNLAINRKSAQPSSSGPLVMGNENATASLTKSGPAKANKPVRLIPNDLLPAFKAAVDGSDLTKAGLLEALKKQFPKIAKDVIKDTLSTTAARVGAKEADKKWVLL